MNASSVRKIQSDEKISLARNPYGDQKCIGDRVQKGAVRKAVKASESVSAQRIQTLKQGKA